MAITSTSNDNVQKIQSSDIAQTQNKTSDQQKGNLAGLAVKPTKATDESPATKSGVGSPAKGNTGGLSVKAVKAKDDDDSPVKGLSKNSPLARAKSVSDPDDKGIKGAAGPSSGAASPTPHLVNNGGKVLNKPAIDNIYLGSYYNTAQGKSDVAHQDAAAKNWVTSGNEAILSQYGVGKGTFTGSEVLNTAAPKSFTDANAQKLIQQQLANGTIKAGDQTIHTIYLPPGTVLKDGSATSQNGLGGFHGSYKDPATGKDVYYAVIAYSKGSNGINFDGNPQDNNSITASHEWSEAATDPNVADVNRGAPSQGTLGWYDNNYGEVGDIAINISKSPTLSDVYGKVNGFAYQKEWSNQANSEELSV